MDTKPLAVRSSHPIDLAEYNEDMLFADGENTPCFLTIIKEL